VKHPSTHRSPFLRFLAWLLACGQVLTSVPLALAAPRQESPKEEPPTVKANQTVPKVSPPPLTPVFSEQPTDQEIFRARVFEEPLVPLGMTSPAENHALTEALTTYLQAGAGEKTESVEAFLSSRPDSPWRPSLLLNLGLVYRHTGYFSRALTGWEEAWKLAKSAPDAHGRAVADRSLAELATLNARLGRIDDLEANLGQVVGRRVGGSAGEKLTYARQAVSMMRTEPGRAFRCGPLALDRVLSVGRGDGKSDSKILEFPSTKTGTNLAQLRDLAKAAGMKARIARRMGDADILLPAVVSWKVGHFAALVRQEGERYLSHDPTFGDDIWITREALNEESTGYFLVLASKLPNGWNDVGDQEGAKVWGKGAPPQWNQGQYPPGTHSSGGGSGSGGGGGKSCGMPTYRFYTMLGNLNIRDTPVFYRPRLGPSIDFLLTYNHKEVFQPQIFYYSNLGPKWTFDWLSYIEDDPASPQADVNLYPRGGGRLTSTGYDPGTQSFAPQLQTQDVIVRTATSPIRYERRETDGSVEVFSQPDGALTSPRKVFLTSWKDPQGNTATLTYDASLRLVAVTDATGQVTTLAYEDLADPLKVTRVTDPFGRSAVFEYNGVGDLTAITDMMGMRSSFEYDTGVPDPAYPTSDFISSMTTPYGTTYFQLGGAGTSVDNPWISATDPLGGTEKLLFSKTLATGLPASDPAASVPTGFSDRNSTLATNISIFWDKRAMALYPDDYSKGVVTKWLWDTPGHVSLLSVKHSEKRPLENRVWYSYPGQTDVAAVGTINAPVKIGRVLDDGSSQIERYEYSSAGLKTREIDPAGRTKEYVYDTNGLDLLEVRVVNGQSSDLLQSLTYNSQHEPLTATDAAGQTTNYTYNAAGQLLTRVDPPHGGLTLAQRTTTYTYDPNGVLQNVTGGVSGLTTTYTYDSYGRVRTSTDPDSYTVTFDYDIFDRPTRTTYPDGTYDETQYDRLDAARRRDRLGRWTQTLYDPLRRVVSTRDPAGRTTTQEWCTCGSLEKLVDPNGNTTTWDHDVQGRVTKETRANATFKTMVYETTTSRLKKTIDAKLEEIQYAYSIDDKLLSKTYVNAEHPTPNVSLSYADPATGFLDAHGRLRQMVDGTGTTIYSYVPFGQLGAGQLASVDGPLANDTVSYGYDELGRAVSRSLNGVNTGWSYDVQGRLQTLSDPIGNFGYTYEGVTGRVASVTYPNGQTSTYSYFPNTGDHRLQEILHKKPGGATLSKFDYTYDAGGNILTWAQQTDTNPAQTYSLEYDRADELTAATLAAATPKRYRYGYDAAGNRIAEQIDDVVTSASYDNMNRLVSQQPGGAIAFRGTVSEPATVTIAGTPAAVTSSNAFSGSTPAPSGTSTVVVAATDSSGNTRTNTYQLSETGTSNTLTYDPSGNLTSDGTRTFEWDAENRLTAVKQGGNTLASFTYDGNGRRATKTAGGVTTTYVYDGSQFLEERPSGGSTKRYVYGPGIDQPLAQSVGGVTSYFAADHLGSVVRTTDATGAPTLTRQYDPWGNLLQGSTTSGYAFTGREWDSETGLYYYRARYYDPKLGRFISEDPSRFEGAVNFYSYVDNRPASAVDPSGLLGVKWKLRTEYLDSVIAACVRSPYGCVSNYAAKVTFKCGKNCGGYRPQFRAVISSDIFVRKGPYPPLGLQWPSGSIGLPTDQHVIDPRSAWEHEFAHLYAGLVAMRRRLEPLEATPFLTKTCCEMTAADAAKQGERDFIAGALASQETLH
jgi:RHS repeat-associated protein